MRDRGPPFNFVPRLFRFLGIPLTKELEDPGNELSSLKRFDDKKRYMNNACTVNTTVGSPDKSVTCKLALTIHTPRTD